MTFPPVVLFRMILHPPGRYNVYDKAIMKYRSNKLHGPEAYERHRRFGNILQLLAALSLERARDLG